MRYLTLESGGTAGPAFHAELLRAGVLLDAAALADPEPDGASGYALIEVRGRDEAAEWVRRWPVPARLHRLREPGNPAGAGRNGA